MQASDSYRELSELRRSLKYITLDGDSTAAQQPSRGTASSSSSSTISPPADTDIDAAQDGDELLCDDSSSSTALLLNSSIAEVDRLLHQFQDTLASFSVPSINSTTIYRPGTASASVDNTIEMNGFLERYSDKLLDMVLQKLDKSK
jgi:hypothetical protein